VNNPDIDIVVELIGGYDLAQRTGAAGDRQRQARGHRQQGPAGPAWQRDLRAAQAKGVMVAFEAAVAGGIPIIKALREGLTANRIESVAGIINGTTNFILSEMRDKGLDFAHRAEAGPGAGLCRSRPDLRHRRRGRRPQAAPSCRRSPSAFRCSSTRRHVEGISKLQAVDIRYAEQLGYRIKLLGITKPHRQRRGGHRTARAPDPDPVQAPDRQRRRRDERRAGAGRRGRRHAVLRQGRRRRADRLGRDRRPGRHHPPGHRRSRHRVPHLAFQPNELADVPILPMSEITTSYYLRVYVQDQLGVMADLTRILADAGISIDAVLQKEPGEKAKPHRHRHHHPPDAGKERHCRHRQDGSPANGRRQRHQDPPGKPELTAPPIRGQFCQSDTD
jgi:homoserine dehydrogenase